MAADMREVLAELQEELAVTLDVEQALACHTVADLARQVTAAMRRAHPQRRVCEERVDKFVRQALASECRRPLARIEPTTLLATLAR